MRRHLSGKLAGQQSAQNGARDNHANIIHGAIRQQINLVARIIILYDGCDDVIGRIACIRWCCATLKFDTPPYRTLPSRSGRR